MIEPIFVSISDAKRALGVGHTRLYELIRDGELEKVKSGNKSLITYESILRYSAKLLATSRTLK